MKRLTIGMPVYNGAATINAALDSLLAQTFTDFDLIISDNGSTDGTQAICESYAARDSRVRYVRQSENLGPAMNFRFVLFEAQTPYFMWAAADDLWAPSFAARNIGALDADDSLVMSQSRVLFIIDGKPSHLATGTYPLLGAARQNAAKYFRNPADNSRYYGVFRTDALKKVFPIRPFYALDWAVSASTLRFGKHNEIQDVLMIRDSSDAAAYETTVAKDHRFLLFRIFPLLFMSIHVLRRRLVPLSLALLYHLAKANLYLHFRFGLYRIDAIGKRYLESNSLRQALGLKRTTPETCAVRPSNGLGLGPGLAKRWKQAAMDQMRLFWRKAPLNLEQRNKIKIGVFRSFRRHVEDLDSYQNWGDACASPRPLAPPPKLAEGDWCFPETSKAPEISIVVVADGAVTQTLRALTAIALLPSSLKVETIVAANAQSDVTALALAPLTNVKLALSAEHGTAGALLRAGAALAQAPIVIFVRAQIWFDDALLTELQRALNKSPLATPRLVYPDGRTAATGGRVARHTGAWRQGRLSAANDPEFSYARTCEFTPGVLAVRLENLKSAIPFSTEFVNFDIAMADFCLSNRQTIGLPLYWPRARAAIEAEQWLHDGTDTVPPTNWIEDWMRLLQSQGTLLEEMPSPNAPDFRMLYIDADTPTPDQNAGSIEAINLMRIFGQLGFQISFIPESNFIHRGQYTSALQDLGVECIHHPFYSSVQQFLEARGPTLDAVVLCRAYIAERYLAIVRKFAPQAKIIFNTVDLHYLREQREAEISGDATKLAAAQQSKCTELKSIINSDATIVLSTFEHDMLAREAPQAQVHVLPLVRDIPDALIAPGPEKRRDIIFIGTYQHPPNADAAIFFTKEVWPLVRARLPSARFLAIGSSVTPEVQALQGNGVEVVGFVPDLDPILERARIAVAPIRFGAGLKGKVATTLQAGIPTVVTSVAAEGMSLTHGREVLIADTPQEMADAIVRLYQGDELWSNLSQQGFAFVRREFSVQANFARIAGILLRLGFSTITIDQASIESELALLDADLAAGDPVFQPSAFWTELSLQHKQSLDPRRLSRFKRTLNNHYMQWLPGSMDDPRVKLPLKSFAERPSMVAVQVANSLRADPLLDEETSGFGDFNPFSNPDYHLFYAFYTGLLWQLMMNEAADDLHTRIEEPELGAPIAFDYKGQRISQDLAQSLLEYGRIKELTRKLDLSKRRTYLELGAGYGRLAYVFLSSAPCRYVIVDIAPALVVSKWYLSRVFPEKRVFGFKPFENYSDVEAELERADIVFLSPNQLPLLPDAFADVSISISSLHEMTKDQIGRYKELLQAKTCGAIYLKQWKSWRNPLDNIVLNSEDYYLSPPWLKSFEATDLANCEFTEQGWLHTDMIPR